LNLPAFVAAHLLIVLGLAVTAEVAGRFLLRGLRAPQGLAPALGLGLLGTLGFVLGTVWQLSRPGLMLALALLLLAAFMPRRGPGVGLIVDFANAVGRLPERLPARGRLPLALALPVALAPPLLLALYPPTAFDETLYHLPFARAFAASGGLPVLPDLRFPVFPQLAEVLFAEVLLVGPDTAVHLVQALAVLFTAALLWGWGKEAFGPAAGALAAAVWLGHPLVVYLGGTAYVEPLLALFVTAAAYAAWRWWGGRQRHWLIVAAFLAGAAAGVKYFGLFFVGVLCLAVLLAPRQAATAGTSGTAGQGRGGRWRDLALCAATALLALLPWYLRIVGATGNPLFPFLTGLFGDNSWAPAGYHSLGTGGLVPYLKGLATLPWDAVFARHRVGLMPPASPVWIVAFPLLLWGAWRDARVRFALLPAAAFFALFPLLPSDVRYLVAVLPLTCLALGGALDLLLRPRLAAWPRLAAVLALLLVLPGPLYAAYRMNRLGPIPANPDQRAAFLARQIPLYPIVARLDRGLGRNETVYALYAEHMRDFVRDGRFLGDWFGPASYARITAAAHDPAAFHRTLSGLDVDYLLIARWPQGYRLPDGPEWRRRFHRIDGDAQADLYRLAPLAPPAPQGP
jgi:Dolichyl-phosphate-mannose-protein mannosyltransferase